MFGSNYRYWDGPEGTRYCFNIEPTFICPNAEPVKPHKIDWPEGDEHTWTSPPENVRQAAHLLGMQPVKLGNMIRKAHQSFTHTRERIDGKLTNRCACCGTKMDRLGFRVWIERPKAEEELTAGDRTSSGVAQRLGFSGERTVIIRSAYTDTKREAKQWCLDERATAQAVAEEETR